MYIFNTGSIIENENVSCVQVSGTLDQENSQYIRVVLSDSDETTSENDSFDDLLDDSLNGDHVEVKIVSTTGMNPLDGQLIQWNRSR